MAVILDTSERGHVTVLLQHTARLPVGIYGLGIGLQLQTLIQSCWQLKQKLQFTEKSVNTYRGGHELETEINSCYPLDVARGLNT